MSEFIQNPRSKKDASAKPWIYPISQTYISCKILTQLHIQVHPAQSLTGNCRYCVGSTEPTCLLQSASSIPAPPWDFKGNIQISSFSYPFCNFYPAIPLYLYNLHPLAVAASSHLVKELSCISFRLVSHRIHWVPHSSNILKFGKQQLLISFIKSWRQWINLYHVLELSWSGSGQLSCPTGFKLWASSLSGPSIQASCSLP